MYPSPYGNPYQRYGMPLVQPPSPPTGLAITGGVIGIVVACIYLMLAAFVALIGGVFSAIFPGSGDMVMLVAGGACLVSILAIVTGAFTCAARPVWAMLNGALHAIFALAWLYPVLDTGKLGALFFTALSLAAAVFSFLAIPQCRTAQEVKARYRVGG